MKSPSPTDASALGIIGDGRVFDFSNQQWVVGSDERVYIDFIGIS